MFALLNHCSKERSEVEFDRVIALRINSNVSIPVVLLNNGFVMEPTNVWMEAMNLNANVLSMNSNAPTENVSLEFTYAISSITVETSVTNQTAGFARPDNTLAEMVGALMKLMSVITTTIALIGPMNCFANSALTISTSVPDPMYAFPMIGYAMELRIVPLSTTLSLMKKLNAFAVSMTSSAPTNDARVSVKCAMVKTIAVMDPTKSSAGAERVNILARTVDASLTTWSATA